MALSSSLAGPVLAALLLLAWGPFVPEVLAQAQDEAQRQEDVRRGRTWIFTERSIDLPLMLELASRHFGVRIEYDAGKLQGEMPIQRGIPYSYEEIWQIANRELATRGFSTVQPPGSESLRVVPLSEAANLARLEQLSLSGALAGYVKVLVALQHRTAETLVETVRLLLSKPGGSVTAVRDANALVISDLRAHVAEALLAIRLLDMPIVEPAVVEIPLTQATPLAVGSLIERIVNTRKQVTGEALKGAALPLADARSILVVAPPSEIDWWKDLVRRFDRPEQVTTVEYTPRRFGLNETAKLIEAVVHANPAGEGPGSWYVVSDGLTGTLVITTTPTRHEAIRKLLERVEATEAGPAWPVRTYPIKNRQVSEVQELLEGLLKAGVLEQGPPAAAKAEPTPQGPTAPITEKGKAQVAQARQGEAEVTLVADESTNRLIAFGEARLLDQLEGLVAELDVRSAQVLVEALVVSLNESQTRDLGVELQKLGTRNGTVYKLGSLFGLGSPDPSLGSIPALEGTGFTGAVLDPGDFSAVLRALETLNEGRSVTVPKVLVNNNQSGTLDSTLQSPFASTNASTTVATTSFGGTFDAGTVVTVKPQVADGDQIVMDYSVALSTFVGKSADPVLPPPRQQTKLQSVVTIPDGHTVVVGGLEVGNETDGRSQVPFLGSVPLLGKLFQSRSQSANRSRFFVFLRCTVLRSATFEDLRFLSALDLAAVGAEDGWPKLEPRIIR